MGFLDCIKPEEPFILPLSGKTCIECGKNNIVIPPLLSRSKLSFCSIFCKDIHKNPTRDDIIRLRMESNFRDYITYHCRHRWFKTIKEYQIGQSNFIFKSRTKGLTEKVKQKIPSLSHLNLQKSSILKMICYNHYSNGNIKCYCCGENNLMLLTLDHINNDGGYKRKNGIHPTGKSLYSYLIITEFKEQLRVSCMNCNWGRRFNKEGLCPHEVLRQSSILSSEIS